MLCDICSLATTVLTVNIIMTTAAKCAKCRSPELNRHQLLSSLSAAQSNSYAANATNQFGHTNLHISTERTVPCSQTITPTPQTPGTIFLVNSIRLRRRWAEKMETAKLGITRGSRTQLLKPR